MTDHTPGPWIACGAVTSVGVVPDMLWVGEINPSGKFRGAIARVQSADHIDDGITREAAAANARLIAALPDLVEALQATCGYLLNAKIDLETGCTKATAIRTIEGGLKQAREALAKAGAA